MGRKYPQYLDELRDLPREPRTECCCCLSRAKVSIRVAHSESETDDEYLGVCGRHQKMARKNWGRFRAHWFTKGNYVQNPELFHKLANDRKEQRNA